MMENEKGKDISTPDAMMMRMVMELKRVLPKKLKRCLKSQHCLGLVLQYFVMLSVKHYYACKVQISDYPKRSLRIK
jgi:hypothetical protein